MKKTRKRGNTIKKLFVVGMVLALSLVFLPSCGSSKIGNIAENKREEDEIVRVFDKISRLNANNEVLSQTAVVYGGNYEVTVITEQKVQTFIVDSSLTIIDQKNIDEQTDATADDSSSEYSVFAKSSPFNSKESKLEKALAQAIELAGISKDSIVSFDFDNDKYFGQKAFDIEITTENAKYEYILSAEDLSVFEREINLYSKKSNQTTSYIEQSEAISIALNAVGIKDQTLVSEFKFSEKNSSGNKLYKITFTFSDYDYEFRINAATSKIVKFEKDLNKSTILTQAVVNSISEEQAKQKAIELIGRDDVEFKKVKIDFENDTFIYEIKAEANGIIFEIEINAVTGEAIDFDSDKIFDDEFEYYFGQHYRDEKKEKDYINKNATEAKSALLAFIKNDKALITSIEVEKIADEFFYEIEVKIDNKYYEYLVNAKTFEVNVQLEKDDEEKAFSESLVNEEQAIKIALDKFSVSLKEAKIKKIYFAKNNECVVKYSVNDINYIVKIDSTNGTIKNFEKRFG